MVKIVSSNVWTMLLRELYLPGAKYVLDIFRLKNGKTYLEFSEFSFDYSMKAH